MLNEKKFKRRVEELSRRRYPEMRSVAPFEAVPERRDPPHGPGGGIHGLRLLPVAAGDIAVPPARVSGTPPTPLRSSAISSGSGNPPSRRPRRCLVRNDSVFSLLSGTDLHMTDRHCPSAKTSPPVFRRACFMRTPSANDGRTVYLNDFVGFARERAGALYGPLDTCDGNSYT